MGLIRAKRLRHATLETADLDRLVAHYEEVIGLTVVARERGRVFLACESGQLALIIHDGAAPQLTSLSLEIGEAVDPADVRRTLADKGLKADLLSDSGPGQSAVVRFADAEGRLVDLHSGSFFFDNRIGARGIAPTKLGHVACYTTDPRAISTFYGDLLGFRISDWIEDRFVFMRCGFEHHTVNFAVGERSRLHHLAFELRDAAHMHRACDILGIRKLPILWGPVRHGPGHNIAIYHRDPDGHVVELFYDLDRMTDEELGYFDPRPWHRDRPQRPKVWVGLPRDLWGGPPSPDLPEFFRMRPPE